MAKKKTTEGPIDFEGALSRLEEVVQEMEGDQLGLAESLERYEEGVKLLKQCQQQLEKAERRIEVLSGIDADGNPVTEPFDEDEGGSLEEKSASRSKRRTKTTVKKKTSTRKSDGGGNLF